MDKKVTMCMALDGNGNFVDIKDAYAKDYICPDCGGIVRPRAKESDIVAEHFYHLSKTECTGEGAIHKYWKENYIKVGQVLTLPVVGTIRCVDVRVEFRMENETGIYQPDLIIKTDNKTYDYIIFEMYNTNKKSKWEYLSKWKFIDKMVYEVDVNKIYKDNIDYFKGRIIFDPFFKFRLRKIKNNIFKIKNMKQSYYSKDIINKSLSIVYDILNGYDVRANTVEKMITKLAYNNYNCSISLIKELKEVLPYCV